jgi:hypothetical protein
MDETYFATDPRLLLLLLGLGFVLALAWVMGGVASAERAEGAEAAGGAPARQAHERPAAPSFDTPDRCDGPIGRYMDAIIFDTASFAGVEYRFDHVLPPGAGWVSERGERCIAPGLVYVSR